MPLINIRYCGSIVVHRTEPQQNMLCELQIVSNFCPYLCTFYAVERLRLKLMLAPIAGSGLLHAPIYEIYHYINICTAVRVCVCVCIVLVVLGIMSSYILCEGPPLYVFAELA